MTFEERVKEHIAGRLQVDFLLDEIHYGLLRDIIEECFLLEGYDLSVKKKAEVILSSLFGLLVRGFDFGALLLTLPESEQTHFLTTLLFHIYYLNLTLEYLISPEKLFYYLLRTLALTADIGVIARLYNARSLLERRRCLGFCLTNFDEGSYRILQYAMQHDDEHIQTLLGLVERKVVSTARATSWLETLEETSLQEIDAETKAAVQAIQGHFSFTEQQVAQFCSVFGIYDHQVPKEAWEEHLQDYAGLDEKLAHAGQSANPLKKAISDHIYALNHDPSQYLKGVQYITYALPTAGKDLSLYAWLPSVTAAIAGFCKELHIANTIPVFVFDQSEAKLFAKNSAFVKSVSNNCIHLDTNTVLSIGKRLQIDKLLETDSGGHFGYGGARNAIFLLMPLLRHYLQFCSIATLVDYVQNVPQKQLQEDFRNVVLNESLGPCVVHMGDDDVHVPFSTVFSDALFAWQHKDAYFCRFGWVKGRKTTWTETSFNLEYVLDRTQDILLQHNWQEDPFRHGMAGLLSKPKLCLNVPFGQEEAYLLAMDEYLFDLRPAMVHLSGYRFPRAELPTNRFAGLAGFLRGHYPYSVGSMLVSDLLDPLNFYKRCSLPWNVVSKNFTSLFDAIVCIIEPDVVKKMKQIFAKNMVNLEKGLQDYEERKLQQSDLAIFHLSVLEIQDVDTILAKYSRFPKEVAELKDLFKDLALDASCFKEVLAGSKKHYPQEKLPITHALCLLTDVINNSTFQNVLKKLI